MKFISPNQLKDMLKSDLEYAVLDVRERKPYSGEHKPFFGEHILKSSCVPLGRLELMIDDLVPRRRVPIFIIAEGASDKYRLAERAAGRLAELGYSDASILEGGIAAWREAGFELFSGIGAFSKAFGEWIAEEYHTPHITPGQQQTLAAEEKKHVILDCRPKPEYNRMTIPGSINAPGADLVYRIHEAVEDDHTLVLVHCAGRTRSIIGAQSLLNAGLANPVAALENGTMGWQLAGFQLEYGQTRTVPKISTAGLEKARQGADRLAQRFGVRKINLDTLRKWQAEIEQRTLYIIDVRLPEEYAAGHWEGSRNVQGGQLIQETDEHISVHNARVVLLDDTEVRATLTASWLIQMGWQDVFVLGNGISYLPLVQGPHQPSILGLDAAAHTITPPELAKLIQDQGARVAVLDVGSSGSHRQKHIPGAWWGIRSRLMLDFGKMPAADTLVVTSEDGNLARLAAKELLSLESPPSRIMVLQGGTKAWVKAGLPTDTGMDRALTEEDDEWFRPYRDPKAPDQAKWDYFAWELGLVNRQNAMALPNSVFSRLMNENNFGTGKRSQYLIY